MPRKRSSTLTEAEQRLMEVLWNSGGATVAQVQAALPKRGRPAFNTVQTLMRILEQKGYLRHESAGRAFVYYPTVERVDASRAAVKNLLRRFFNNSAELLTVRLLEDEQLGAEELDRLKRLTDEARRR
jgi:predicted transcriptional regulator